MSIWIDFIDFFFPRFCICCGKKLLPSERSVCLSCVADLPYTGIAGQDRNLFEKNFWGCFPIARAATLFYYKKGGNVAHLVHAMKYHSRRMACVDMGKQMAYEFSRHDFFRGIDYILPVPLHKERLRIRGYNQSQLLSLGISRVTGIPLLTDVVERTHNNVTQTRKSGYERWMNAQHLFVATPRLSCLEGKHVLLVDDVLTTGATIVSLADAIAHVEGIKISVATLAWAKE